MKSWWRQYAEKQGALSGKGSWARQAAEALGATGTGSYAKRIANNVGPFGTDGSHERQMVSSKTGSGSWIRQAVESAPATGAPINTVAPAITGTATVGQTLTCSQGTWDANGGTISGYTYQWKSNGTAIVGATSSTYVLVSADTGTTITCTVTATNENGSTSATTAGVGPVAYDPATLFPSNGYWFDASDMSKFAGVAAAGDTITSWADSSGNAHTLTTTGAPTWQQPDGDAAALHGNAADYLVSATYTAISAPYYVAIGFRLTSLATTKNVLRGYPSLQEHNPGSGAVYNASAGTSVAFGTSDTSRHVAFMKVDPAGSQIWIDGTSVWTGSMGSNASTIAYVGGVGSEPGNTLNGYVYQLILSDNAQMLTDRTSIEAYINSKMGL